jgi:hypothetical protein
MKKILMTLAAVLCCAMTATVLTACGSDSDDDNTPPAQPKVVAYQVDYSLEIPQEIQVDNKVCGNLFLLCDKLEVEYTDENGQEQKEVINNGKWAKTLNLYLTKPKNLDTDSLPYDIYTSRITVLPNGLQGVTAIYDNGKSENAPRSTYEHSSQPINLSPYKNKVQQYFDNDNVIASKQEVLYLKLYIQ